MFTIFGLLCATIAHTKLKRIMKNYILLLLFVFGLVNYSNGQVTLSYELRETIDFYKTNKFINDSGKNQPSMKNIKGSPYLNDEFEKGSIYTVQRLQYADIPLRYNIFNDELEFKTPANEIQALATPEIVEKAVFGKTHLVYSSYTFNNKIKKGFFVVLEEGKATLYVKPGVIFKEATEPAAYQEAEPPKFEKKADDFYLRFGTAPAQMIGNKKELIAAFPDNKDKIESYIDKNKVKTNKSESLKELVKYYNSME